MPPPIRRGKSANDRATKDSLAPDMLSLTLREKSPRSAYTPGDSERRVRPSAPALAAAVIVEA
jgi:hypothetical protein